jgi:hypothetical protein
MGILFFTTKKPVKKGARTPSSLLWALGRREPDRKLAWGFSCFSAPAGSTHVIAHTFKPFFSKVDAQKCAGRPKNKKTGLRLFFFQKPPETSRPKGKRCFAAALPLLCRCLPAALF